MTFMESGGGGEPDDQDHRMWLAKKAEWWKWHCENPQVWEYFERFAAEAVGRQRTKISHWLIINRIRWEVAITTTHVVRGGEDFKISNDMIAFYARYWKHRYPQHASLFTTKRMIGEPRDSPLIGS